MKLPEHRRAITGRTFAQQWEPRAVEIHTAPFGRLGDAIRAVACVACCVVIGFLLSGGVL